jgi:hypothetical protein
MHISIGYIWSENNNEMSIPWDFEIEPNDIFSELNDLVYFNDKIELDALLELPFPESWGPLTNDHILLASFASWGQESYFDSFLDSKWVKLIETLGEEDNTSSVLTPNGVEPLSWLEASDEEKINFAEPGARVSFDLYHFGILYFDTSHTSTEQIVKEFNEDVRPLLEKYLNSPGPYGFGNLNHECGPECSSNPCIRSVALPAFLSIEF